MAQCKYMSCFDLSTQNVAYRRCVFKCVSTCTVTTPSHLLLKVIFTRDGNVGRLIIDGLRVMEDRVQGGNVSWNVTSPLYIGGVPPGRAQKNIQVWV